MAVLAGIDEAGLGPKLGPLVLGLSVFEGDPSALSRLFTVLRPTVAARANATVPIGDSKKLYGPKKDLAVLERGLFACWRQWRDAWPGDLLEWLDALDVVGGARARTRAYPWYQRSLSLPRAVESAEASRATERLSRTLARRGVRIAEMRGSTLDAAEVNAGIREHGTKNVLNFFAAAPLVKHVYDTYRGHDDVELVVDRHGGRKDYAQLLRQLFYPASVSPRPARKDIFSYVVRRDDGVIGIRFVTRGDGRFLPVALASMIAKYTRELHMELFNDYWRSFDPDLKPTAGYPVDAARFLADIAGYRERANAHDEQLVRER